MSGRRGGNRIRGPQSALTDFLASHNISAAQIRDDFQRRLREVDEAAAGSSATTVAEPQEPAEVEEPAVGTRESSRKKKKKNKATEKEVVKDKKKDKLKSKKRKYRSDDDEEDEWNDVYRESYKKPKKLPGQLENCEACEKRFTVTPYSKTGPEGGLLCTPCGKELTKDNKADKAKKVLGVNRKRRKVESDRLDGRLNLGSKSLQQLCIEKVANHYQDLEELGDLPEDMLERIGEIFTKRRVLKPDTLKLFLRSDLDNIVINDCAYLQLEDYEQIFSTAQNVSRVVFNNACQFQDRTLKYMAEKARNLRHLTLYAANLVSDDAWRDFFQTRGKQLETLKLQWLDSSFDVESVTEMSFRCTNLRRLKLHRCRRLDEDAIGLIGGMKKLEHLSLNFSQPVSNEALIDLVSKLGKNLQTISLIHFQDADDGLLAQIHSDCHDLSKLRLSNNDTFSDHGFVSLFKGWTNPPLVHIDLSSTRDIDNANPDGPELAIGLSDNGFKELMQHSGDKLEKLNISSCRHISTAAFMDVFDGKNRYSEIRELDLSFCNSVDTVVVAGIFKTCPKLKKLVVFGCFSVDSVVVPANVLVIGAPKAQDAIEQFGHADLNVEQALGGMLQMIEASA